LPAQAARNTAAAQRNKAAALPEVVRMAEVQEA